jgi:hypothetical protein
MQEKTLSCLPLMAYRLLQRQGIHVPSIPFRKTTFACFEYHSHNLKRGIHSEVKKIGTMSDDEYSASEEEVEEEEVTDLSNRYVLCCLSRSIFHVMFNRAGDSRFTKKAQFHQSIELTIHCYAIPLC